MDIVTLLEQLVNGLLAAEENFLLNPKDFYSLEKSVKSTTDSIAAKFMELVLNSINDQIYNDGYRKSKYTAQRTDKASNMTRHTTATDSITVGPIPICRILPSLESTKSINV